MTYFDVANLAFDTDFLNRCSASYATETLASPSGINPENWAADRRWQLAAQPGFGEAFAYAIASNNPNPGRDPAVITDAQILSAVQAMMTPVTPGA